MCKDVCVCLCRSGGLRGCVCVISVCRGLCACRHMSVCPVKCVGMCVCVCRERNVWGRRFEKWVSCGEGLREV